jgi:myosin heavy subunit
MNKSSVIVIVVLGIALVAAGVFCFILMMDKNALSSDLDSTRTELASTQLQLDTTTGTLDLTEKTLSSTKSELDATNRQLTATISDLTSTKDTLTSTQSELDTTNQTLTQKLAELQTANFKITSVQNSLDTLQASVSETRQQLATAQDTLRGLGITLSNTVQCYDAKLVDNVTARDPTWKELMAFIAADKTEKHPYVANEYDCSQFSRDVHNNAEAAGIKAAVVHASLKNENVGHAFNAFLTTDCGLVYVDCTGSPDKIAYCQKDKPFRAVNAGWVVGSSLRSESWWNTLSSYYYLANSSGGHAVVESIEIYW